MNLDLLKKNVTEKIGLLLLIFSLTFYFLLKLPFNLSARCMSGNEGFYFIFGHFLHFGFPNSSGPLFVLFYSLILKIFGFGVSSLVVFHFIQTIFVFLIGGLIYLILTKILGDKLFAGLGVLLRILIMITPFGKWGPRFELTTSFSLDAEYFCVLFSLFSIYLFVLAEEGSLCFLSGIFAGCSFVSKASGAILSLAVICWLVYMFFFNKKELQKLKGKFILFFIGLFLVLLFCSVFLLLFRENLFLFWKNYFIVGSYSKSYLSTFLSFSTAVFNIMTRETSSVSNFLLFFFTLIFFAWGLTRNFVNKLNPNSYDLYIPLISIWFIGNVCTLVAAGAYSSYYYTLLWPSVVMLLIIGIKDLYDIADNFPVFKRVYILVIVSFLAIFFSYRGVVLFPVYTELIKEYLSTNVFLQKESSQKRRTGILGMGDAINNLLPGTKDTFFAFNFTRGDLSLGPNIYIYAKRLPSTVITSDFLHFQKYINKVSDKLIKDLTLNPPKLIIAPEKIQLPSGLEKDAASFLYWFASFTLKNYHLVYSLSYELDEGNTTRTYKIFERNY